MSGKKYSEDMRSLNSTECDSSEERDDEMFYTKTNKLKHKTELCKTFSELGYCNYGNKCRFAHGAWDLVKTAPSSFNAHNRKCKGFWKKGYCPYGIRCQFGHAHSSWEGRAILKAEESILSESSQFRESRLLWLLQ